MKHKLAVSTAAVIAIIVIVIAVVAGAWWWYASTQPGKPVTTTTTSTTQTTTSTTSSTTSSPSPTTTYTTTTTSSTTTTQTTTSTPIQTTTSITPTTTTSSTTTTTKPSKGIVLHVLTRHPADILDQAKKLFLASPLAKKYHIVNIVFLPIEPVEWISTIQYAATRPGQEIDVAWGGGPTMFDLLMDKGFLAPINSSDVMKVLKYIPAKMGGSPMIMRNSKGQIMWIAAALASFGFTINKGKLHEYGLPTPQRWIDLASPVFAATLPTPSVGVADPTMSTSNTRMYQIILQIYGWQKGWEIITRMGANSRIYFQSGLVRDAVIRGDVAVGITIDFYGYTAQLKNPKQCQYILPKDGTIVNGDPIAMINTTKHPLAAEAFIAWVLSPQGQALWMNPNINRMPINPLVFNETKIGRQRTDLKMAYEHTIHASTINFNDTLALETVESMRWFFYATITQAHETLQSVWRQLALAYLQKKINQTVFNKLAAQLGNPYLIKFKDPKTGQTLTFTLQTAIKINNDMFNPKLRNQYVSEWIQAAKARYNAVLQELKSYIG